MIVMKFGGSSVQDATRIKYVSEIIRDVIPRGVILVFSAFGDTTDDLLSAGKEARKGDINIDVIRAHHIETANALNVSSSVYEDLFVDLSLTLNEISQSKRISSRHKDTLVSFGERLAVRIISAYLNNIGIKAKPFDAWEIGFTTDSQFGDATLHEGSYMQIRQTLAPLVHDQELVPVVTGFIAKDSNGQITTLGRGGSDLTASVIGAALNAEEIQVWKDVDGLLTADPRVVPSARPVPHLSFDEASELAYFGAKILHPRSILPAMRGGIPVRIKNSYNPTHPGTVITKSIEKIDEPIKSITSKKNVTLVDIASTRMLGQHGFLAEVFKIFADLEISVDVVASSEVSISLTLDKDHRIEELRAKLEDIASVEISSKKAIVSLVGDVERSTEILFIACQALHAKRINIQMISQGASKVNISFIIEDSEVECGVKELHRQLIEEVRAC